MKTLHDAIFSPWMPLDPVSVLLRRKFRGGGGASGAYYTLTGTLPLTLVHSLAAAIRSLVRTGAMTQTPAPTPDAPVYPSINGGTVQMVDDELPAGYKRLLGITFDGNFHYRTGEYLTSDDIVTMTLDNISSSGKNVFGSYNGANGKNFSLYIYGSTSGSYFRFGDVLKRPVYGGTGRRTITFGAGGTSGFAEDVSIAPDEFTTPANTYIGMLPNSSSAAYTGDIVGSILVGTRLEWIPCERDGGVIGYYERVNGNFIAPTGSGTPVSLGYDTSHLVPRVVGTPEVLSVGTQTATVPNLFAVGDYADEVDVVSGTVTRNVGMHVFDGTENFVSLSGNRLAFVMSGTFRNRGGCVCTHFPSASGPSDTTLNTVYAWGVNMGGDKPAIWFRTTDYTASTLKTLCAEQFAAGTPLIAWFVLQEPTTESITPQALRTQDGTTVVSSSAGSVGATVEYKASEEPTNAPTEEGV